MINGAQSVLDDVVITDTPSPNQVLDRVIGDLRYQRKRRRNDYAR